MASYRFFKMAAVHHLEFFLCITHEQHLMVFITVQNLTGTDAVFLIICEFLASVACLQNAYSRPLLTVLGDLTA